MLAYGVGSVIVVLAVWILAISTGWGMPYIILNYSLMWLKDNPWESIIIAVALLFIGVLFIVKQPRTKVSIVMASKYGEISVTEDALREIILRSCLAHGGVHKVRPDIKQRKDGMEITISSQLDPGVMIPQISEEMQLKVKEDIENYTGIRVAEVKVRVRSIESAALPARVR